MQLHVREHAPSCYVQVLRSQNPTSYGSPPVYKNKCRPQKGLKPFTRSLLPYWALSSRTEPKTPEGLRYGECLNRA